MSEWEDALGRRRFRVGFSFVLFRDGVRPVCARVVDRRNVIGCAIRFAIRHGCRICTCGQVMQLRCGAAGRDQLGLTRRRLEIAKIRLQSLISLLGKPARLQAFRRNRTSCVDAIWRRLKAQRGNREQGTEEEATFHLFRVILIYHMPSSRSTRLTTADSARRPRPPAPRPAARRPRGPRPVAVLPDGALSARGTMPLDPRLTGRRRRVCSRDAAAAATRRRAAHARLMYSRRRRRSKERTPGSFKRRRRPPAAAGVHGGALPRPGGRAVRPKAHGPPPACAQP